MKESKSENEEHETTDFFFQWKNFRISTLSNQKQLIKKIVMIVVGDLLSSHLEAGIMRLFIIK